MADSFKKQMDEVTKNMMNELAARAKAAGAGFAPSGTPEATWSIYVYGGKVYVPRKVRTKDGGTMTTGPIAIINASDSAAVAAAIVDEVARNVPVVPEPDWSSPEHLNRPTVKEAAGTKNYKGFTGWGVVKQGGKFYAVQLRMEPDGANVPAITKEPPHADAAGAAKQIAAEIAESQQPGQIKTVPAKSKAKPNQAESSASSPVPLPDRGASAGANSSISEEWLRKNIPGYANMSPGEQRAHRALAKPDAVWSVYVYEGRVYIPSLVTTELGGMLCIGPIAVVDAAKSIEVAAAITAEVAKNMPVVPVPDWGSVEHQNQPTVTKAAGRKNYVGFYGWCVTRRLGEYYAQRLLMEPEGGGALRITSETPFAKAADAAGVIAAEVAESQQPGQTKYVPARTKGKPKLPAKGREVEVDQTAPSGTPPPSVSHGADTPPTNADERLQWRVYARDGKMYLPSLVRLENGRTRMTRACVIVDASDLKAVEAAILAEVAKNAPDETPEQAAEIACTGDISEMIRRAKTSIFGTRNYAGGLNWGLYREDGKFYVVPRTLSADGSADPILPEGYQGRSPNWKGIRPPTLGRDYPPYDDAASAAKVIAIQVSASQQPGQSKDIAAGSKAKAKQTKNAPRPFRRPEAEPEAVPGELTIEQLAATAPKAKRPTEAQIAAFEATLVRPLPPDYRRFLLLCNGEVDFDRLEENEDNVFNSFHTINHVKHLQTLESVRYMMQDPDALRISEEVLPIGDGVVGDSICIGLTGKHRGKIFLWDHENEPDPDDWDGTVKGSENIEVIAESFTALVGKIKIK